MKIMVRRGVVRYDDNYNEWTDRDLVAVVGGYIDRRGDLVLSLDEARLTLDQLAVAIEMEPVSIAAE